MTFQFLHFFTFSGAKPQEGLRAIFVQDGPEAFAKAVRNRRKEKGVLLVTFNSLKSYQLYIWTSKRVLHTLFAGPNIVFCILRQTDKNEENLGEKRKKCKKEAKESVF